MTQRLRGLLEVSLVYFFINTKNVHTEKSESSFYRTQLIKPLGIASNMFI